MTERAAPTYTVQHIIHKVDVYWNNIPIRVYQDGRWQSLFLSDVKDQGTIAEAIINWLTPFTHESTDETVKYEEVKGLIVSTTESAGNEAAPPSLGLDSAERDHP